ncbi:DUF2249 domain-containing protein [Rhizobium sp. G21]|uniref:DUF2249 domain-containing protein n=1 Tax=Rhizobium sp. G21 TaxID=2758439 RepID=UPI0015FF3D1E|nr:DUF2249 domain-containing protein [Rhizobium sp. G21]MBB1251597.1 DUF2249 domain-containing protein [Rhizobium sp. G21]
MSSAIPEIDVRVIPPSQRHPSIFGMLAQLEPGRAMQVTSDHDPRPLHHQIMTRFPDEFGWDYVEEGPEVWKVLITRAEGGGCDCCCGGH